jgi:hypothetical protein
MRGAVVLDRQVDAGSGAAVLTSARSLTGPGWAARAAHPSLLPAQRTVSGTVMVST